MLCFYSFFLSFSNRTSLWHLNRENLLRLGTLFVVPSHPILILLIHLISDSVMRRPTQTSLRTSKTVAFIWNAKSFCQISPTLRYPMSFGLEDRNLFVRNLCVVPLCLFKSFTPIYTTSIHLCLNLFLHSEVHVS